VRAQRFRDSEPINSQAVLALPLRGERGDPKTEHAQAPSDGRGTRKPSTRRTPTGECRADKWSGQTSWQAALRIA
jgi:hypothetical protein